MRSRSRRQIASATSDATLAGVVKAIPASSVKFNADWIKYSAEDLVAAKGRSLVLVGSRQPVAVQVLVAAINAALGNIGKTIVGRKATEKPAQSLTDLAREITDKKIKTLFIVGGNPVYNAPADLDWAELAKVGRARSCALVFTKTKPRNWRNGMSRWRIISRVGAMAARLMAATFPCSR